MEYLCLTLAGRAGESESAFQSRLIAFWTHVLRNRPDDYERVYAEAVAFEQDAGRATRGYMVEPDVAEALLVELAANGIEYFPLDRDDVYSKAEASTNEWFQID